MLINLSPYRPLPGAGDALDASRQGDTLIINGQAIDLSGVTDPVPAADFDCEYLTDNVKRIEGTLHVTLRLPIGADATEAERFPVPIIDPSDGPLALPSSSELPPAA